MRQAAKQEVSTQERVVFPQGKVQSFQHYRPCLRKHRSQKVLTSHKSRACWPFLTKMFMHSHDLIEATLESKRKLMKRKEWSTKLFKIATHATQLPFFTFVFYQSLLLDTLFPYNSQSPLGTAGMFPSRHFRQVLSVLLELGCLCHSMSVSCQEDRTNH